MNSEKIKGPEIKTPEFIFAKLVFIWCQISNHGGSIRQKWPSCLKFTKQNKCKGLFGKFYETTTKYRLKLLKHIIIL